MSKVLHRQSRTSLPVAVRGEGAWVIDASGKRYLDAAGGAAVSCLGHGHPAVIEAVKAQLDRLEWTHTSFFTSAPAEALAERLIDRAPGDLAQVYFVSGGSEATEAALKLARQFAVEIGQPARRHVIARRQSYHGNTLGALAVGGNAMRRAIYRPLLVETFHVAPCYAYRDRRIDESEERYGRRVADELEATIERLGPETVLAFIAEPVVGATLGAVPAVPGYFKRVREICDRHGVLLILDEVMCGMGRTGTLHACTQDGIAPDLLTVAKGLGGGYQPIGAVLVARRIVAAIRDGSGAFQHGHTYMAHPVACAAALAVQEVIARDGLLAAVRRQGAVLQARLEARFGNHHHVGDVRGRGLLLGLEFVADRASKEPFDPALGFNAVLKRAAMDRGLMVYAMGGTIDGRRGDHLVLAPPYTLTDAEIEQIVERLGAAVDDAVAAVQAQPV